jgi:hypothetical protein
VNAPAHRTVRLRVKALPAQRRFWDCAARYRAFVGGVGSGKTYAGAIEILRQPAHTKGLVIAPTYPQMRDASQATFFELCPSWLIKSHNKSENITVLADGKKIYWRSADRPDGLRGPNLSWMWLDEGSFAKSSAWDIGLGRLRVARWGPTRAWVTTTPNGIKNWLYEVFVAAKDPECALFKASTRDNHHNEDGYAERLARRYGQTNFALQELEGEFVDLSGESRLPSHLWVVEVYQPEAPLPTPAHLPVALRLYRLPQPGREYVAGADPAEGVGGDDSALVLKDKLSGETVAVLADQLEPTEVFPSEIERLCSYFNGAAVLIERNNHGHAVIAGCRRRGVRVLLGPDEREGWLESQAAKVKLYDDYAAALMAGDVLLHDARTREQLGAIHRVTLRSPLKGKVNRVDDEAIAEVLAHQARLCGGFTDWRW